MRSLSFVRHVYDVSPAVSSVSSSPLNGDYEMLDFKAAMFRSPNRYAVKVGVFEASSRAGQALQGVASVAIPGDMSEIRSPVRSRLYAAATPGGVGGVGGVGAAARETRGYRCPEGFQYGGRFTDNRFSTCGQMLFDIFPLGQTIGQAQQTAAPRSRLRALKPTTEGEVIPGVQGSDNSTIISRAAQIPKIGAANTEKRDSAVAEAMDALKTADNTVTLMVRRDGFAMRPVVSTGILRTVPDNRNMEGATYLTAVSNLDTLGGEELGLLSNTGIRQLQYVAPNGVSISLTKDRELTTGEKRALGRAVNDAAKLDNTEDPLARLKKVVDSSKGGISLDQDTSAVKGANDFVEVEIDGTKKRVRKWVKESFLDAAERPEAETPAPAAEEVAEETDTDEMITSLAEAIKHLNDGGDWSKIIGSILPQALESSDNYNSRRTLAGGTAFQRGDDAPIRQYASRSQFEHLNAAASSEIAKAMGLDAQTVKPSVGGSRMPYVVDSVQKPGVTASMNPDPKDVTPESVVRLAAFDFLTNQEGRADANTFGIQNEGKINIAPRIGRNAFTQGASRQRSTAIRATSVNNAFNKEQADFYKKHFAEMSERQKRAVVEMLNQLLENARRFSFERMIERLKMNGEMSNAETAHLNIMRSIFESRLKTLADSRERFLSIIGVE